jgi:hypothetical protein
MAEFPECNGRVTGGKYMTLPDGHRTTLVVGMSDMLNLSSLTVSEQSKAQLEAWLQVANPYQSDDLRRKFDDYMNADSSRQKFLVAGCFAAFLNEICKMEK